MQAQTIPTPSRIVLIGYRATGKSTVGRILAGRFGYEFIDTDDLIESRSGRTIARLFATDGESVFRDLEACVVSDVLLRDRAVVSLGGGAILRESSRQAIVDSGAVTIWLVARPETLARRLQDDAATVDRRPPLTRGSVIGEIQQVLSVRTPIYRECATFEFETDGQSPDEIAMEIAALFGSPQDS